MTSKTKKDEGLSHTQYLTIVYSLGLKPCGKKLAMYTGLSVRQLQRIYARECPIPKTVQILLGLYAAMLANNARPKGWPE